MHGGDLADIDREQLYAGEGAAVVEIGDISELTAKPADCFDDNDVEDARMEIGQKLLITRTKAARAADRGVGVSLDQGPTLFVEVAPAHLDLVVNRSFTLVLQAVASINDRAHQEWSSSSRPSLIVP